MSDDHEQLVQRVQKVDAEGRDKYGEGWGQMVGAIARANPQGIPDEAWRVVLAQDNAHDVVFAGGREALITMASNGDREADRAYSQMRNEERRQYRLLRGRGPA